MRLHVRLSVAVTVLAVGAGFLASSLASAQDLHPSRRKSPMGMARITVDGTYIRVVYSRPYERGRDNIFGTEESGALVPFGKVWRTGANEAAEITVTGDVAVLGEKALPAGTYSLFTTPGAEEWKIHFNSALGFWGTDRWDPEAGKLTPVDLGATDVVTVTVPSSALGAEEKVDQFTISFEPIEGGADMVLRWITTEVRVPIKVAGG